MVKCEVGQSRKKRIRDRSSGGRRKNGNDFGVLDRHGGGRGVLERWSWSSAGNEVVEANGEASGNFDIRE